MTSKELNIREKILHKYLENPGTSKTIIAKSLNVASSTVYDVIKRFIETSSINRKERKYSPTGPVNKPAARKVIASLKTNPGLSDSDRGIRYGVSPSTGRRIRQNAGYKSYKVIKQPNRNDKQSLKAKTRARKLYQNILTKIDGCVCMDDETYVKCDFRQLPGQNFYASKFRGRVPDKYKFVLVDKFAKKYMIWQAICTCGLKSRCFVTSGTMNSEVYTRECLQKRLLPFLKSHRVQPLFWPDLASCHYSIATKNWYQGNQVRYVPVDHNPPNCPELRPIEIYWAVMKRKLKKKGGTTKDINSMTRKWNNTSEKLGNSFVQALMAGVNKKVRKFIRN